MVKTLKCKSPNRTHVTCVSYGGSAYYQSYSKTVILWLIETCSADDWRFGRIDKEFAAYLLNAASASAAVDDVTDDDDDDDARSPSSSVLTSCSSLGLTQIVCTCCISWSTKAALQPYVF